MTDLSAKLDHLSPERRLYTLQSLPQHLADARQINRVVYILSDLDFIEAKFSEDMAIELLQDYEITANKLPEIVEHLQFSAQLSDFKAFVRAEQHILSRYPELTLQQAANQPPYSAPEMRAYEKLTSISTSRSWIKWLTKPRRPLEQITLHIPGERIVSTELYLSQQKVFLGTQSGQLWCANLSTGKTYSISLPIEHIDMKSFIRIPNTQFLLLGTKLGHIIQFETEREVPDKIWETSQGKLCSIALNHDGSKLITANEDGKVCLWALATGNLQLDSVIHEESERITSLTFALEDRVVVIGTSTGLLRMLDLNCDWSQFYYDQEHLRAVNCLTTTNRGSIIWTGSLDGSVRCLAINKNLDIQQKAHWRSNIGITHLSRMEDTSDRCIASFGNGEIGILSVQDLSFLKVWQHDHRIIFSSYDGQSSILIFSDVYGNVQAKHVPPVRSEIREKSWDLASMRWIDNGMFLCVIGVSYGLRLGNMVIERTGDDPDMKLQIIELSSQHIVAEHKFLPTGSHACAISYVDHRYLLLRVFRTEDDCGIRMIDIWSGKIQHEFYVDLIPTSILVDEHGQYCLLESYSRVAAWDLLSRKKLWEHTNVSGINNIWIDSTTDRCGWIDKHNSEVILDLDSGDELDIMKNLSKSNCVLEFNKIVYFDAISKTKSVVFDPPDGKVAKHIPLPDNKLLVLMNNGVLFVIAENGHILDILNNHSIKIQPILLNSSLLTVDRDNQIIIWETQSFSIRNRFPISQFVPALASASKDTGIIALGVNDHEIHLLKLEG